MTPHFPLDDDGTGGVVAEIHLTGGPVEWGSLATLFELLTRAAQPMTIVFRPDGPPPIFLTVRDTARVLGLLEPVVTRLVRNGTLPAVLYNRGEDNDAAPIQRNGRDAPDPTDPLTGRVVAWDDVVAFATDARNAGHFPFIPKTLKPTTPRGFARRIERERIRREQGNA